MTSISSIPSPYGPEDSARRILVRPLPTEPFYKEAVDMVLFYREHPQLKDTLRTIVRDLCANSPFQMSPLRKLVRSGLLDDIPDPNCIAHELFDRARKTHQTCPDPGMCKNCMHHVSWIYRVTPEGADTIFEYFHDPDSVNECYSEALEDASIDSFPIITREPILIGGTLDLIVDTANASDVGLHGERGNMYRAKFFTDWEASDGSDSDENSGNDSDESNKSNGIQ